MSQFFLQTVVLTTTAAAPTFDENKLEDIPPSLMAEFDFEDYADDTRRALIGGSRRCARRSGSLKMPSLILLPSGVTTTLG